MKYLIFVLLGTTTASAADYSANLGVHSTAAQTTRGHVNSKLNGRFGLGIDLTLGGPWTFATGTDYVFRRVTWRRDDGARLSVDFDYIDVPADLRVRVCPIASVYAGLRFGINVSDKVEVQRGVSPLDARARAIITLGEAGLRFDLPWRVSLDGFFEREIGDGFAASLSDYASAGARVNYSF